MPGEVETGGPQSLPPEHRPQPGPLGVPEDIKDKAGEVAAQLEGVSSAEIWGEESNKELTAEAYLSMVLLKLISTGLQPMAQNMIEIQAKISERIAEISKKMSKLEPADGKDLNDQTKIDKMQRDTAMLNNLLQKYGQMTDATVQDYRRLLDNLGVLLKLVTTFTYQFRG